MEYSLENANRYIRENKDKVPSKYRPLFHMVPPVGWMNDPNGLTYRNGVYDLFYQFYPYDSKWGPMHWGHFRSKDLIKYEDMDVALSPLDQKVESGCFSGGSIINDGRVELVYTRHFEGNGVLRETIHKAVSMDGINFIKTERELFDNDTLPSHLSRTDFRDPCPIYKNGYFYIFVGTKNKITNEGIIAVLKSRTMDNFEYAFEIGPIYELGEMGECPSYLELGGYDILIASGVHVAEKDNSYRNINSSVFIMGHIDFENGRMDIGSIREIDKGDAFYAPQNFTGDETLIVGWLEMWAKKYVTDELGHGYAGALTMPRRLSIRNGMIYQSPVDTIENYYKNEFNYESGKISRTSDVSFKLRRGESIEFVSSNGRFTIGNSDGYVYLSTEDSNNMNPMIRHTDNRYIEANVRIILDNSCVEAFISDGLETISSRVFLDDDYTLCVHGNMSVTVRELDL